MRRSRVTSKFDYILVYDAFMAKMESKSSRNIFFPEIFHTSYQSNPIIQYLHRDIWLHANKSPNLDYQFIRLPHDIDQTGVA